MFIRKFIILNFTYLSKINLNVRNMEDNIRISALQVQNNYKSIIKYQKYRK
jgi:hypothetical protein